MTIWLHILIDFGQFIALKSHRIKKYHESGSDI